MRMLWQIALAGVLVAGSALADDWNKTWTVAGSPSLRVETDDGRVTIRPGGGSSIVAHVTTNGWKIGAGEVQVRESQQGNHVDLMVKIPHRPFTFSAMNRWIHVDLEVPRRLQADIRTGDGAINIEGVTGEVRLHTGDGHIDAMDLDGSLSAESGDGHIKVRARLDQLTVHTGDGSVEADVLTGSKVSSSWRLETGDGSVTLRLPDNLAADLDLHTGDGGIQMDMPNAGVTGKHERDLRARLNGGGAPLAVRTGDGSIHIRRL